MCCRLQILITIVATLFSANLFGASKENEKNEYFGPSFIYSQSSEVQNLVDPKKSVSRKGPTVKQTKPTVGFSYFYRAPETIFLGADISLLDGKRPHYFFPNEAKPTKNIGELKRTGFEFNLKAGYTLDLKEKRYLTPYALYGFMETKDKLEKTNPNGTKETSNVYETNVSYFGAGIIFSHPINDHWRADIDTNLSVTKKVIFVYKVDGAVQHGIRSHISPSIAYHIPSSWVTLKSGFEYNLDQYKETDVLVYGKYRETKFFLTTYLCF